MCPPASLQRSSLMRKTTGLVTTLIAMACLPAAALAADPYEPNDTIGQASPPLVDNTLYRGEILNYPSGDGQPTPDKDYFKFTNPQDNQQTHLKMRFWGGSGTPAGCALDCVFTVALIEPSGYGIVVDNRVLQPDRVANGDSYPVQADGAFHARWDVTIPKHGDYLVAILAAEPSFFGRPEPVTTYELQITRDPGASPPAAAAPVTGPTSIPSGPTACDRAERANTRAYKRYLTAAKAYRRKHTRKRRLAKAIALKAWRSASRRADRVC